MTTTSIIPSWKFVILFSFVAAAFSIAAITLLDFYGDSFWLAIAAGWNWALNMVGSLGLIIILFVLVAIFLLLMPPLPIWF